MNEDAKWRLEHYGPRQMVTRDARKVAATPSLARIPYAASFSEKEFEQIRLGLMPHEMEDKWLIYWSDDAIWIHRSWTGFLTFRVTLRQTKGRYAVVAAEVSTDETQYHRGPEADEVALLDWIIRYFLLEEDIEFPLTAPEPPGVEWTFIDTLRTKIASPVMRMLHRLRQLRWPAVRVSEPLPRNVVEEIARTRVRLAGGEPWSAAIFWVDKPLGVLAFCEHRDGPTHDFVEPLGPFFVSAQDGTVTALDMKAMSAMPEMELFYDVNGYFVEPPLDALRAIVRAGWPK